MMNDTMSTTFQQQIRNFNSLSFDVSVPLTNTLHGMQSLLHLSSTKNELTNANVCYAEFNLGLSVPESADVPINNDNDDLTVPIIERCPFQRNTICLPPDIAFQIERNCDVLPFSLDDLLNYTILMLKFCTNKLIGASPFLSSRVQTGTKVWYNKSMPVDWPSCQHM
jgi:hypothetical protein